MSKTEYCEKHEDYFIGGCVSCLQERIAELEANEDNFESTVRVLGSSYNKAYDHYEETRNNLVDANRTIEELKKELARKTDGNVRIELATSMSKIAELERRLEDSPYEEDAE